MKLFLICINILLASMIVWQFVGIKRPAGTKYTVRRRTVKTPERKQIVLQSKAPSVSREKQSEENAKIIIENNIFNLERCPNAAPGAGNVRVQMTLVGVCIVGKTQGAVILQKQQTRSNNNNFFPPPPMMGGPGRQMGFMQNNNNNNSRNRNRSSNRNSNSGGMGMGPGGMGMGPGGMGGPPPMMGNPNWNQNQNQNKKQQIGTYRQYIRVGETLSNGYKLVSVTRDKAILTRGSDRLELELQDASVNAPKGAVKQNRTNFGQQMINQMMRGFQNIQRMQGFQNMQMMRMMQGGNNGGPQQGGRSRNNSRR